MKNREGFWFTVGSYIVEHWLFPGYHLSRMPTTGAGRKKKEVGLPQGLTDAAKEGFIPGFGTGSSYPNAGE